MYQLKLCLRYLRTRWIALASVVSVMLGVATLIVVNCVMGGFATEMRQRIKAIFADVMIEGDFNGFADCDRLMAELRERFGDRIEAMTTVVETFGLVSHNFFGRTITQPAHIIGVNPEELARIGKFAEFLQDPRNQADPASAFEIRENVRDRMEPWRKFKLEDESSEAAEPAPVISPDTHAASDDPFAERPRLRQPQQQRQVESVAPDSLVEGDDEPAREMTIIVPWLLATVRRDKEDKEIIKPGDSVLLTLTSAQIRTTGRFAQFTVVDRFRSGMSEYDQTNCYVDIRDLQRIRGMGNRVTSIQIKLKDYAEHEAFIRDLEGIVPQFLRVLTWEQKQGPILSAVAMEQNLLNILLFMIIAVAGFGILAMFFMIVVEKTRDIGILKSLGASDRGVGRIFLWYGLSLGTVGSGIGMAIGLAIVLKLDTIEKWLSKLTGQEVFDRDLYYFDKIPAVISPSNIAWIVGGALLIAIAASVLPARRAASLRPVEALRFE